MPVQPNQNYFSNPSKVRQSNVTYGIWKATAANMGSSTGNHPNLSTAGVFTLPDSIDSRVLVTIGGLSSETMAITMSNDGTNYSAALLPVDDATGLDTTAATLANGRYRFDTLRFGSPKFMKFTKSSTSETGLVVAVCASPVASQSGL